MPNFKLIDACMVALEELNALPYPEARVDLDYAHCLYLWTLRNIYDEGMEYSELAREIIFEMSYWPEAMRWKDHPDYDESKMFPGG